MDKDIQNASEVHNDTAIGSIADSIESRIFTIRGKQVMIDRDQAELYGVTTGNLNKAVARNISRFPSDFMFELSAEEWKRLDNLLFQNGIPRHGGSRYAPHAFTEHGIVVLANTTILDRMQALEPKENKEQLFQNGCVFDAWTYVSSLIKSAKQEIILIDNYTDETVLALFAKRADGVSATIHTRFSEKFKTDHNKFNEQYPDKAVKYIQLSQHNHDRFLIIDEDVYLLGASLKDLGNTWGAIIKMNETKKTDILNNLRQ